MPPKYKVSVVRCSSYSSKEVRKAIEESLKNIDFKFKKNMKILIKPNILGSYKPEQAITTHPVIIEELCKILKKFNAEIYIGDSSQENTDIAFETSGIKKLSKYARIINFDNLPKRLFDIGNQKIFLPEILFQADLIINLPKMKTHGLTNVTLSIKNLFGCIPGKQKQNIHMTFPHPKDFSRFLAKLHEKIKPQLNIIDGITGIQGEGPGNLGEKINPEIIISGTNAIATDIIASEFMGFDYRDIYTNNFSKIKKQEIDVLGNGKDIRMKFKKPILYLTRILRPLLLTFPKPKIRFYKNKCTKCLKCEKICPVNAIKIIPQQICNHKKCIKCLCCIEVCPEGAVYLEENWLKRFAKKIIKIIRKK